MGAERSSIIDPKFWRLPLRDRMAGLARIREQSPFALFSVQDPVTQETVDFYAVTRYHDVVEISRRPRDFCSGRGAARILDLSTEAMEFFGSFIEMDDPRHARQRGIVSRAFTPRMLQRLLATIEITGTKLIDEICELGTVDLVEAISKPFPLWIICDLMGIPRSEFHTLLDATDVILGGGDPELLGGHGDAKTAQLEAGRRLRELMDELAADRKVHPRDDLTTMLVHNTLEDEMLTPDEIGAFFILLAVAGTDTTRTAISVGIQLLSENPDQRMTWQAEGDVITGRAIEEILRTASPVNFMRRTVTRNLTLSDHDFLEGDRVAMFYGAANRDPEVFRDPDEFDIHRNPNPHLGFGGPGPHFCLGAHLARHELAVIFRQLLTRLPDIELAGVPVPLESLGIPLVGGIKRLPVKFTPTPRMFEKE